MSVTFLPPQLGIPTSTSSPVPYTGNPFLLCWFDILLFIKCSWSLVGILHPWNQWLCGPLDELYPSLQNLFCLFLHGCLIVLQLAFLAALPFLVVLPVWTAILFVAVVMAVNYAVCRVLNGREDFVESIVDLGSDKAKFEDECWVYLNGVSVG